MPTYAFFLVSLPLFVLFSCHISAIRAFLKVLYRNIQHILRKKLTTAGYHAILDKLSAYSPIYYCVRVLRNSAIGPALWLLAITVKALERGKHAVRVSRIFSGKETKTHL